MLAYLFVHVGVVADVMNAVEERSPEMLTIRKGNFFVVVVVNERPRRVDFRYADICEFDACSRWLVANMWC